MAIVVVSGVGDAPPDSAATAAADALMLYGSGRFTRVTEVTEHYVAARPWFHVEPEDPQVVRRVRLEDAEGTQQLDVLEMWWADLSRFPGAMRSMIVATIGMLIQLPTVGMAALRGGPPFAGDRDRPSRADRHPFRMAVALLGAVEWMVAVPILLLSLLHLAMVGGAALALWSGGDTLAAKVGLGVFAVALVVGTARYLRPVSRRTTRPDGTVEVVHVTHRVPRTGAFEVGVVIVLATIGVGVWRVFADGGAVDRGVAEAVLLDSTYAFRGVWLVVVVLVLALTVALTVGLFVGEDDPVARGAEEEGTAVGTTERAARRVAIADRRDRVGTAFASLTGAFGLALFSAVLYAAAGAALGSLADHHWSGGGYPLYLATPADWTPCSSIAACDHAVPADLDTARQWGNRLFSFFLVPLVYVLLIAVAFVIASTLAHVVRALVQRARGHSKRLDAGTVVSSIWPALGAATPFCALAVIFTWVPVLRIVLSPAQGLGAGTAAVLGESEWPRQLAAVSGVAVAGMYGAARFLGFTPVGVAKNSPGNEGFRVVLDQAYDIATFLREAPGCSRCPRIAPRHRMLARFATLLAHLDAGGSDGITYDRIVVFAHSQGTVLSTAILHRHKDPDDPSPDPPLPPEVGLITAGTPLRHLYMTRLPVQFRWVRDLARKPAGFVDRVSLAWCNFSTDNDPAGRSLFQEEPEVVTAAGPLPLPPSLTPPLPYGDWCIGPGGHAAYWSSPIVFQALERLATLPAAQAARVFPP